MFVKSKDYSRMLEIKRLTSSYARLHNVFNHKLGSNHALIYPTPPHEELNLSCPLGIYVN